MPMNADEAHRLFARRQRAWERLAKTLAPDALERTITTIGLAELPAWADKILAGQVQGRVVVDVNR